MSEKKLDEVYKYIQEKSSSSVLYPVTANTIRNAFKGMNYFQASSYLERLTADKYLIVTDSYDTTEDTVYLLNPAYPFKKYHAQSKIQSATDWTKRHWLAVMIIGAIITGIASIVFKYLYK